MVLRVGQLIAVAALTTAAAAQEAEPCTTNWVERYDQYMVELARVAERDPGGEELRGLRVTWGGFEDASEFGPIGGGFYLTGKRGRDLDVWDAGVQISAPYLGSRWFGFGPRFKLGVEHRDNAPDKGLGGVAGLGIELGVWIGGRVQVLAFVDREFGFSSGTRNQVGIATRIGIPGLEK